MFKKRVLRWSKKPTLTVQEIHFVHFPKMKLHPSYLTFLRDPVDRFKSRYQWSRSTNLTARIQFRSQRFYEPVQVRNKSFKQWRNKDLESCVMKGDEACNYKEGEIVDHPLVC